MLLSAAAVLLGALLAVYGQTYQTGADPWGLFATWALLILPWAVAACFTPLWLLVIGLIDTAHVLYLAQVRQGDHWELTLVLGLVAVHVLGVMAWEAQSCVASHGFAISGGLACCWSRRSRCCSGPAWRS